MAESHRSGPTFGERVFFKCKPACAVDGLVVANLPLTVPFHVHEDVPGENSKTFRVIRASVFCSAGVVLDTSADVDIQDQAGNSMTAAGATDILPILAAGGDIALVVDQNLDLVAGERGQVVIAGVDGGAAGRIRQFEVEIEGEWIDVDGIGE